MIKKVPIRKPLSNAQKELMLSKIKFAQGICSESHWKDTKEALATLSTTDNDDGRNSIKRDKVKL